MPISMTMRSSYFIKIITNIRESISRKMNFVSGLTQWLNSILGIF